MILGVDVGTYEVKGVLVDTDGSVVASASCSHELSVPVPGWAEHDADEDWWGGLVRVTRELLASPGMDSRAILGVCCSGIGPAVVPVRDGRPLSPAILYGIDTRASAQVEHLNARLGDEEITRRCGNTLSSQSAGPKIAWMRDERPEVHAAAEMFATSQSYLVARLTGRWVIDHGTAAYFHPLYDIRTCEWNVSGCEDFVDDSRLPELAWPSDVAGTITAAAADETGLPAGIPVFVGTADAPAEALSAGVVDPGDTMLMYGSSHFVIRLADAPVPVPGLYLAPYVFPGSYVVAGGTSTAGTLSRWFWRLAGGAEAPDFDELVAAARMSPPGARGLLALPYFSGERTPLDDPLLTGGVHGLTLEHRRGDVYRAILEGIGFGLAAVFDRYRSAGLPVTAVHAAGGGIRHEVWMQAVSDIAGVTQLPVPGTGASYGDAMLAAVGVGILRPDELSSWVTAAQPVRPDPAAQAVYQELRPIWDDYDRTTRRIAHRLRGRTLSTDEGTRM